MMFPEDEVYDTALRLQSATDEQLEAHAAALGIRLIEGQVEFNRQMADAERETIAEMKANDD